MFILEGRLRILTGSIRSYSASGKAYDSSSAFPSDYPAVVRHHSSCAVTTRCPASTGSRRPLTHLACVGVFPMWGPHNGAYALASHWTRTLRTTQLENTDREEAARPEESQQFVKSTTGGTAESNTYS